MEKRIKTLLNKIIHEHKFVMFEFTKGYVYWLQHHHKYLDPEDAERILLGKCETPKLPGIRNSNRLNRGKIVYLTTKI